MPFRSRRTGTLGWVSVACLPVVCAACNRKLEPQPSDRGSATPSEEAPHSEEAMRHVEPDAPDTAVRSKMQELIAKLPKSGSPLHLDPELEDALIKLGRPAVPFLVPLLKTDRRRAAVWILGRIGDPAAVPSILETAAMTARTALTGSDAKYVSDAVLSLALLPDERALPVLEEIGRLSAGLENHWREVRFPKAADPKMKLTHLPKEVRAWVEHVRKQASRAQDWSEIRLARGVLATLVSHVGMAMCCIGGPRAREFLRGLAHNGNPVVRGEVAKALASAAGVGGFSREETQAILEEMRTEEEDPAERAWLERLIEGVEEAGDRRESGDTAAIRPPVKR